MEIPNDSHGVARSGNLIREWEIWLEQQKIMREGAITQIIDRQREMKRVDMLIELECERVKIIDKNIQYAKEQLSKVKFLEQS